jgi:hypothetical protein
MWRRVYTLDMNVLLFMVGGTGTCKSGSAITIANDFDLDYKGNSRFDVENHVFFSPQEFMNIAEENYPSGSVFIWDEMQVGHGSRDFYELKNKLVNKVLTTFRYKNYVLIMTLPALYGVDKTARELGHFIVEMDGKDPYDLNRAKGHLTHISTNPKDMKGKIYFPYFRLMEKNCPPIIPDPIYLYRPNKELETAYKEKKERFMKSEYASYSKQLNFMKQQLTINDSRIRSVGELMELLRPAEWIKDVMNPNKFKVESGLLDELLRNKKVEVSQATFNRFKGSLDAKLLKGEFEEALRVKPIEVQGITGSVVVGSQEEKSGGVKKFMPPLNVFESGKRIRKLRQPV